MGFIPRRLIKQNLQLVDVLVEDTANQYFNVVELPETFVQGRSSFKIFGSALLKKHVPLKIEMLDSSGTTVYCTPVDLVGEEVEPYLPYRFVTVEVYRPPVNRSGLGQLNIVGEIEPSMVDFAIPSDFVNTYNVRYSTTINLDLSTFINPQPIRFYKNPTIIANEIVKSRIVNTPVTQSVRIFASASAAVREDIRDKPITLPKSGSQVKEEKVVQPPPSKDVEDFVEDFGYKTGLKAPMPAILKRRGLRPRMASKEIDEYKVKIKKDATTGGLTSKMQGATVTIPEHKKIVKTTVDVGGKQEIVNEEVTVKEKKIKIKKVIDDTTFVPDDIVVFPDPVTEKEGTPTGSGAGGANTSADEKIVIVDDLSGVSGSGVPISMSFDDVTTTIISSSVHFDSFMDLTIKNMRPFSGDVYRIKIHGQMQSSNAGYTVMADTVVESPELIRDTSSPSGYLRSGYFFDQTHLNTYWTGSSYQSNTRGDSFQMKTTGSQYIDSMHISGSNYGAQETIVVEQKSGYEFRVERSVPYTLTALIAGRRTNKEQNDGTVKKQGKLYFHLTGSNLNNSKQLPTNADVGGELGDPDTGRPVVLELDENKTGVQKFDVVEFTFMPGLNLDRVNNTDTKLQIRADSGRWHISDLSLRPAMDTGFSPDEFNIVVPLPRSQRPDKLDIFIEYFDINNTTVETVTVRKDIPVSGSALIIDGSDNLITGSLFMGNTAGAGIEMAGANSAFMRSVGYKGFISASVQGHGGFMIFSGSVLPDESDNYEGAGLEIHDGTTGDDQSYFKFRTKPSIFDVRSKKFFMGSEHTPAAFVSGSEGNIQISSSTFHLSPEGHITASNFDLQTGTIRADVTIEGDLSANSIAVPTALAPNYKAEIKSDGFAKFTSASIATWNVSSNYISAPLTGHSEIATSRVYLSNTNDNTQNIQQGLQIYRDDDDTNVGEVKVIRVGGLSDTSNLHATASNDYGIQIIKNKTATSYENLMYIGKSQQMISGWNLNTGSLSSGTEIELNSTNKRITINDGSNDRVYIGEVDGGSTFGMKIFDGTGNADSDIMVEFGEGGNTIAGWTIDTETITGGALEIHSVGRINSTNYASNQYGWIIDSANNGQAEFENVRIRGTLKTTVFEKETVNAVGGQLYVANSSTITGSNFFGTYIPSASATTATMSIANVSGFTGSYGTRTVDGAPASTGEILAIKKVTSTGFSTEYVQVHSASRVAPGSDVDLRGHIYVTRAYNQGVAGDSGSLGDLASTAASYAEGQVIVSTGRVGTGFVRINANPNDFTTPYMDIVERTGSGVYDTELKVRLGDMSGLSKARLQGTDPTAAGFGLYSENVFLEGGIVANTGSIAGVHMKSNQLYLGTGTWNNSNTPFYVSGKNDATKGDFSLGDKLVWDASEASLAIAGSITITGGPSAAQLAQLNTKTSSLDTNISDAAAAVSASVSSVSSSASSLAVTHANAASTAAANTLSSSLGAMAAVAAINSGNNTTYIGSNAIVTSLLATNAIQSTNYDAPDGGETFADAGTFLDLSDGAITSKQFLIDSSGNASFAGNLSAAGGTFTGVIDVGAVGLGATTASLQANTTSLQNQTTALGTASGSLLTASSSFAARARISQHGLQILNSDSDVLADYGQTTTIGEVAASKGNVHITSDVLQIRINDIVNVECSSSGEIRAKNMHLSGSVFADGMAFRAVKVISGNASKYINGNSLLLDGSGGGPPARFARIETSSDINFIEGPGKPDPEGELKHPITFNRHTLESTGNLTISAGSGTAEKIGSDSDDWYNPNMGTAVTSGTRVDLVRSMNDTKVNSVNSYSGFKPRFYSGLQTSNGAVLADGAAPSFAFTDDTNTGIDGTGDVFWIYTAGTKRVSVNSSGLISTGDVTAYGTVASDERLKTNVKTITIDEDRILNLNPVEYEYKYGEKKGLRRFGFIAQELEKEYPEVVKWVDQEFDGIFGAPPIEPGEQAYKTIEIDQIMPMVVKFIQKQNTRIESLEKQVEELKNGNSK